MFRSLPIWLLALVLPAFVGCGGGGAADSGAVASNSNGSDAGGSMSTDSGSMGSSDDMMGSPGGADMGADMSGGAEGEMDEDMYGGAEGKMDEDMYGGAEGEMDEDMYGAGGELDEAGSDFDSAEMEELYGTGPGSDPGDTDGTSPEEMQELYGTGPGGEGANSEELGDEGIYGGGEYTGGPGGGEVEEKIPEGFEGKAQLAFRRGKEKDALQFLYAHALTTDAGAESILPGIRWVGGLRQPKLAVRWGVGFVVTAPRNFNGDPKPVGSNQKLPTRGGSRGESDGAGFGGGEEGYGAGAGGDEGYGGEGGGGGGSNSLLSKGAGELGEKLAAAYTERVMRGDFGDVLKKASEAGGGGNRSNGYGEEESDYGGAGSGGPGGAGPGGVDSGYGAKAGAEGGGRGAAAAAEVTQIKPGLSMLGIGTQKELIERAREHGIDAIVVIDVKLRVSPSSSLVTNDSTLALLDVKTQKKLHTTKKFNNISIQKLRTEGKEDGVDKGLAGLFEAIDKNFKMTDLPAGLNAEVAAKRIAGLAAEQHDNPLPVLAEARMYHTRGLLEESALFAAYEQILGVDFGRLLATGEEEDKKRVLNRWLPEL